MLFYRGIVSLFFVDLASRDIFAASIFRSNWYPRAVFYYIIEIK